MRISSFRLNAAKKVAQGYSLDEQYRKVNAARDKRKARRERNMRQAISGGYKNIPIIQCL